MATQHDSDSESELLFEDAVEDISTAEANTDISATETNINKATIETNTSKRTQTNTTKATETELNIEKPVCALSTNPGQDGSGESSTSETHASISPKPSGKTPDAEVNSADDSLCERLASATIEGSNFEKCQEEASACMENENGASMDDEETESCSDSDGEFDDATVEEFLKEATEEKESRSEEKESESEEEEEGMTVDDESLKERDATLTEEEKEEFKEKAQKYKAEGNRVFKEGNYTSSIAEYTSALQTCPLCFAKDRSIMYSNRGAAKLHLEKYEAAIDDCTRAIELNPAYLKALVRRAELYEKTDKLDEALSDHTKVLELDPSQYSAREACMRLPDQIKIRNEKMKEEMLGKLKDLGNVILKPFGLSTNNFQLQQDPNSGGYSVKFQQNQPRQPPAQ